VQVCGVQATALAMPSSVALHAHHQLLLQPTGDVCARANERRQLLLLVLPWRLAAAEHSQVGIECRRRAGAALPTAAAAAAAVVAERHSCCSWQRLWRGWQADILHHHQAPELRGAAVWTTTTCCCCWQCWQCWQGAHPASRPHRGQGQLCLQRPDERAVGCAAAQVGAGGTVAGPVQNAEGALGQRPDLHLGAAGACGGSSHRMVRVCVRV
jgi:hypothetical protein